MCPRLSSAPASCEALVLKVLILGGYGHFGFNIASLLSHETDLSISLAGRNFGKARKACERLLKSGAQCAPLQCQPLRLDRSQKISPQLSADTHFEIVIDATGPFQEFGALTRHHVFDYALEIGADYIDLSDDTDFSRYIVMRSQEATAAQICAMTGLSTYPVFTRAVLEALRPLTAEAQSVSVGIAPSPKAYLGKNVLKAILAGAGRKAVYERKAGETAMSYGLGKSKWMAIAPPLIRPLPPLLFLQVDSPSAQFMPETYRNIENYAGPQPLWMMRLLRVFTRLSQWKLLPPLRVFAGLFHKIHHALSMGEHRSGFFLEAEGAQGKAQFFLIAEGDDGPLIPSIPAAIIIKKRLAGERLKAGAYNGCESGISFADFDAYFKTLNISHNIYQAKDKVSVYRRYLGGSFSALPAPLQALHDIDTPKLFQGECKITRGRNPLGRIICGVFGFPKACERAKVSILMKPLADGSELWERNFNGRTMRSIQSCGQGRRAGKITERFGIVSVDMSYFKEGDKYRLQTSGWRIGGLPMPKFLCPGGNVYESAQGSRFHFHVQLCVPFIGEVVKYVGWFNPVPHEELSA